jgi:hypothetical protein
LQFAEVFAGECSQLLQALAPELVEQRAPVPERRLPEREEVEEYSERLRAQAAERAPAALLAQAVPRQEPVRALPE